MFNFSKSPQDLRNKNDVQFKVICDWLRTIDNKVNKINRSLTVITSLLEDDSQPADMEIPDNDNSRNSDTV